jgi:DNA repair protein RAD50
VHDPRLAGTDEVKALIKLRVTTSAGRPFVVVRSLQVTRRGRGGALTFKSLEAALQTIDRATNDKRAITMRCTDIDRAVPTMMGVSKAILESVIFVHQEDSCWPLSDGATLKRRFDDIFAATKYSKALESLAKLRKDKTAEARELKLRLETIRAHVAQAQQLRQRLEQAEAHVAQYEQAARDRGRESERLREQEQEVEGQLRRHASRLQKRQQLAAQRSVLAQQEREALERLPEGDPAQDPRTDDELQREVDLADERLREQQDGADAARRGANGKRLEAERLKSEYGRKCQEHGRLAAEAEAHSRAVAERDKVLRQASDDSGVPLPATAVRALESGQPVPSEAVAEFRASLERHMRKLATDLDALRQQHQEEDGELARGVDEASRALAEAEGERRLHGEQADASRRHADELDADADRQGAEVDRELLAAQEQDVRRAETRLDSLRQEDGANEAGRELETLKGAIDDAARRLERLQSERESAGQAAEANTEWKLKKTALQEKLSALRSLLRPPQSMPLSELLDVAALDENEADSLCSAAQAKARARRQAAADAEARRREAQQAASEAQGQMDALRRQADALREDRRSADRRVWEVLREAREALARGREERVEKLRKANAQAMAAAAAGGGGAGAGAGGSGGGGPNEVPAVPAADFEDLVGELVGELPGHSKMIEIFGAAGTYQQPGLDGTGGSLLTMAGGGAGAAAAAAGGSGTDGGGSVAGGAADPASAFAYSRVPELIAAAGKAVQDATAKHERVAAAAKFLSGSGDTFANENCCTFCKRPFQSSSELELALESIREMLEDAPTRAKLALARRRLAEEWAAGLRKAADEAARAEAASRKLHEVQASLQPTGTAAQQLAARQAALDDAARAAKHARELADQGEAAVRDVAMPAASAWREKVELEAQMRDLQRRIMASGVGGGVFGGGGQGYGGGMGGGSLMTAPDPNYVPSSLAGGGAAGGGGGTVGGATQGAGGGCLGPGSLVNAAAASAAGLTRAVSEIDREIANTEGERRRLEAAREEASRRHARLKDDLVRASAEVQRRREVVQGVKAQHEKLLDTRRRAVEERRKAEQLAAQASAREQQVVPLRERRDRLAREREAARVDRLAGEHKVEERHTAAAGALYDVRKACEPVDAYNQADKARALERASDLMRQIEQRAAEAADEAARLEAQARELEREVAGGGAARRANEDLLAWRRARQRLEQLTAELAESERADPDLRPQAELHARYGDLQARRAACDRDVASARGAMAVEKDAAADAKRQLSVPQLSGVDATLRVSDTEHRLLVVALADLDRYQRALERALLDFHSAKMAEVNRSVRELWQKVYRGSDIDHVAIKADSEGAAARSYNYRVVMMSGGAELDMRGRCSAGQKVLASLVIRLALAECFCASCGVLALDEPTTNLDADNAASLAESLRSLMEARRGQDNFQVVVITHDEQFAGLLGTREYAEVLWRVTKDDRGHTNVQAELIDQ